MINIYFSRCEVEKREKFSRCEVLIANRIIIFALWRWKTRNAKFSHLGASWSSQRESTFSRFWGVNFTLVIFLNTTNRSLKYTTTKSAPIKKISETTVTQTDKVNWYINNYLTLISKALPSHGTNIGNALLG